MYSRKKRGLTLALVLQVLAVLAVIALALAALGILNLREVRATQERSVLMHTASGGVDEVIDLLYNNPAYGTAANPQSGTVEGAYPESALPWARYFYSFDSSQSHFSVNNLDGLTPATGPAGLTVPAYTALTLVTAGRDSSGPVRLGSILARIWPYAIAADGSIDVAAVDTVGPDPALRSNLEGSSPTISAESLNGSAYSSEPYGSIDISGNPQGRQNFDQPPITLPNVPIATVLSKYATDAQWKFTGNQSGTSDNDGTLHIGGQTIPPPPVGHEWSIYVNGDLRFNGGLKVPKRVHFFVTGTFLINGGGGLEQLSTNSPAPVGGPAPTPTTNDDNFVFANFIRFNGGTAQGLYLFAETGIDQNGSSDYTGLAYVRNGDLVMSGTSRVDGVVITRGGEVRGPNTDITYDPRVLPATERFGVQLMAQSRLRRVAWWRQN